MDQQNSLVSIHENYKFNTDKQGNRHSYLEVYDTLFEKFRDSEISILEIGVLAGDSLKLWSVYFPKAKIYGVDTFGRITFDDVKDNIAGFDERIELYQVDSVSGTGQFFNEIGDVKFSIILDDGTHTSDAQIKTYNNFKSMLDNGGIYIIEDIRAWCKKHNHPNCKIDKSCKDDTHLYEIQEKLPEFKIIDMNEGFPVPDNILGVFEKINWQEIL